MVDGGHCGIVGSWSPLHTNSCHSLFHYFFIKVCGEALYLRAVLSEPCWEGTQLVYFYAVGIPMLLVYVVGLPLAVLVAGCPGIFVACVTAGFFE